MLKKFSRMFVVLLVVSAMLMSVVGCAKQEPQAPASDPSSENQPVADNNGGAEERVTLTVLVEDMYVEDHETNYYTKMLEEKANVDLEFIVVSSADFVQKLSLMINGGEELPDVIANHNVGDGFDYGTSGFYIPLNDYFNDAAKMPNFNTHVKDTDREFMLKGVTTADGNIYSAPHYWADYNVHNLSRMFINMDWLKALNLEMPTTTEEFYQVLKAFKEQDPNGNGIADEVPLLSASKMKYGKYALMDPFVATNYCPDVEYMIVDENGKVSPAFTTEGWKQGLEYMNKLVSEGLLASVSFTQDNEQFRAMVRNEDVTTVGVYASGSYDSYIGASPTSYEPLAPLTGPEGYDWATYHPFLPSGRFVITKDCDNVDAAVRLMDALYDPEVCATARWGEEGVDWTREIPEGYETIFKHESIKEPGYVVLNQLWGTTHNKHWTLYTSAYSAADNPLGEFGQGADLSDPVNYSNVMIAKHEDLCSGKEMSGQIVKLLLTEDQRVEYGDLRSAIVTYVDESFARFATGDMPLSEWDNYLKTLDSMGLDRYIELVQEGFNASGMTN